MTAPDSPTFEELLTDPHVQFDPDGELLPHLIAFGPPKPSRAWLFDAVVETTVPAWSPPSPDPR